MHIAEVVTIAKSLPLLRLNTYKSLILSYSADYRRILVEKTTETGRYSSFGRIFCRLIIRKLSKCFLKTFQEEVRFVHAETQGRQQAEYVRAADTGKHMLFFQ